MKRLFWILSIILLILSILGIWWFSQHVFTGEIGEPKTFPDNYVIRIIDGDTFELGSGDIVRLLCINTPEIGKEGYEEASGFLESLILNKEVILEADVQDMDNYNRLLRYVYINDSGEMIFVNKEIYQAGYAEMMIIAPSDSKCGEISSVSDG